MQLNGRTYFPSHLLHIETALLHIEVVFEDESRFAVFAAGLTRLELPIMYLNALKKLEWNGSADLCLGTSNPASGTRGYPAIRDVTDGICKLGKTYN